MTETSELPKFGFADITRDDFPALVTLNDSCVPHVNSIGLIELENFSDQAVCFFKVCDQDANLAGFVIAQRLHRQLGFESVGTQATERGSNKVVLLVKPLIYSCRD